MKKLLLLIMVIVLTGSSNFAQWFGGYPVETLYYDYHEAMNKQILIMDSSLFLIKHGGLEEINTNDFTSHYKWLGFYPLNRIVADTSSTIVFLRSHNYIGRFDFTSGNYVNIWPSAYNNKIIRDIDVAPDGKVWTICSGTSKEIGIWNGNDWQFHSYNGFTNLYGTGLRTITNNSAIISAGPLFFEFQNGNFDTLFFEENLLIKDWDADAQEGLWIASTQKLIHIFNQNTIIFDSTNTPIGEDEFRHVSIGTNGHIWVAGNTKKVYKFDGTNWTVHQYAPYFHEIENLVLDEQNEPWIVAYYDRAIYKRNGNSWVDHTIPFMPINQSKAAGIKTYYNNTDYFATDEGYFTVNLMNTTFTYADTTSYGFENDITCFTENDPEVWYYPSYGTHHGVYGIQGFDNNQLLSQQVNSICQYYGTYYIATDSGLTAFNGIFYNHFNMDNSPLPSNKITFVTTDYSSCFGYNGNNGLYVGTDKGIAVYKNAEWTVYDTGNINISNFYVTGILPYCYDEFTYVTTLGNGLIKIFPDGEYETYNTMIGNFEDDTLYYVKFLELMECGSFVVIGTSHHGIAYSEPWGPENFQYDTQYEFSTSAAIGNYFSTNILTTDKGFMILTPCGPIRESTQPSQLTWLQQSDNLIIKIPSGFKGNSLCKLNDMYGRAVVSNRQQINAEIVTINIGSLSRGVYIFSIDNGTKKGYCKVLLTN